MDPDLLRFLSGVAAGSVFVGLIFWLLINNWWTGEKEFKASTQLELRAVQMKLTRTQLNRQQVEGELRGIVKRHEERINELFARNQAEHPRVGVLEDDVLRLKIYTGLGDE